MPAATTAHADAYRAARMAAVTARQNNAFAALDAAAAESDRILAAADAAGVDLPIAAIEREVAIAHGLPVWPPATT